MRSVDTRSYPRRSLSAALLVALFVSVPVPLVAAHGGLFRGPTGQTVPRATPPPGTGGQPGGLQTNQPAVRALPGSGPQIPFSEERWEFWWEYNNDRFVNLRQALRTVGQAGQGQSNRPFQPPKTQEKRDTIVPFLINRMLRDKDDQVRSAAAFTLAQLGESMAIPFVEHLALQDVSLGVRANSVVALGISQSPRAIETLQEILADTSAPTELRSFAAISLGLIGSSKCSGILKEWLDPKRLPGVDYQLRLALAYAIGLTHDLDNAPLVRELLVSNEIQDYVLRSLLVQALGQLGDRAANALLVSELANNETQARRSAVLALANVAGPADKDVIEGLLRVARSDNDSQTRNFAYIALGRIASGGQAEIEKFLLEELDGATHLRRAFVALALGLVGNRENVPALLRTFAATKEPSLRSALALALGLLRDTRAIPAVRKTYLAAEEPVLASYLALALGLLGDLEAAPRMLATVKTETDVELLARTVIALGLLGERQVVDVLQERYKESPDQLTRASLVYGLGLVGDRDVLEPLEGIAASAQESDLVRAFAVLGLGHVGALALTPVMAQITQDVNYTLGVTFISELWNLL
ncbi:MAG: HEAT repeat domain-containing protein [Planctomycetota bacterium]